MPTRLRRHRKLNTWNLRLSAMKLPIPPLLFVTRPERCWVSQAEEGADKRERVLFDIFICRCEQAGWLLLQCGGGVAHCTIIGAYPSLSMQASHLRFLPYMRCPRKLGTVSAVKCAAGYSVLCPICECRFRAESQPRRAGATALSRGGVWGQGKGCRRACVSAPRAFAGPGAAGNVPAGGRSRGVPLYSRSRQHAGSAVCAFGSTPSCLCVWHTSIFFSRHIYLSGQE